MAEFVQSGRIVDLILAMVAAEGALLIVLRLVAGRGPSALASIVTALSGVFLLLALRAALTGAGWPTIVSSLLAAFAAHLVDLRLRWPNQARAARGNPNPRRLESPHG